MRLRVAWADQLRIIPCRDELADVAADLPGPLGPESEALNSCTGPVMGRAVASGAFQTDTNAIEALNRQLQGDEDQGSFLTEDATRKLIYLAILKAVPQWTRGWTKPCWRSKSTSKTACPTNSYTVTRTPSVVSNGFRVRYRVEAKCAQLVRHVCHRWLSGLAVDLDEESLEPVSEHVVVISGDHVTGCLYVNGVGVRDEFEHVSQAGVADDV